MGHSIDQVALKQLFIDARTHNAWQPKPVLQDNEQLKQYNDLLRKSVLVGL